MKVINLNSEMNELCNVDCANYQNSPQCECDNYDPDPCGECVISIYCGICVDD